MSCDAVMMFLDSETELLWNVLPTNCFNDNCSVNIFGVIFIHRPFWWCTSALNYCPRRSAVIHSMSSIDDMIDDTFFAIRIVFTVSSLSTFVSVPNHFFGPRLSVIFLLFFCSSSLYQWDSMMTATLWPSN